jgi:hypothetical protein
MADKPTDDLSVDTRWRSFWRQFTRRWSYVRREARAQTLGMFVFVLVLLTAGALCARTAMVLFRRYSQAVQGQLESAVAQGEPRADIEFPAVTAAVLAPINQHLDQWSWNSLAAGDAACRGHQVLETAAQLMSAGLALLHDREVAGRRAQPLPRGKPIPSADLAFVLSRVDAGLLEHAPRGWVDSVAAHAGLLLTGDRAFVQPLPPDSVHIPPRQYAQGWIGTQISTRALNDVALTSLLVPSTFVIAPKPNREDAAWGDLSTAAIASLFLEDAMRLHLPVSFLTGAACDSLGSIVQIYFISERSVLRIFPARPLRELPPNRYWAAAHYFQRYFSASAAGEVRFDSPPYIDIGDQGVVRTLSRVVPSLNRSDSSGVFGVLFIDYKLPEQRFLDELARHNVIFDLKVLRLKGTEGLRQLRAGAGYTLLQASASPARRPVIGVPPWRSVDDPNLIHSVAAYAAGLEAGAENHTLGRFGGQEHPTFVLPLGTKPTRTFLIVTPQPPHMPWDVYVYGLLATVLLVTSASALVNWRGVARLQLERFENQTFRRNLPVGVLRLDHRDAVLDANQVAEWALGATLQQEGEQGESDSEHRTFGSMIEPNILIVRQLDSRGWPMEGESEVVKYKTHLRQAREWPTGCTYFAVTRLDSRTTEEVPGRTDPVDKEAVSSPWAERRVIQVSEAPNLGEPPLPGPRSRVHVRNPAGRAIDLGESAMVPRTDLIVLTVMDIELRDHIIAKLMGQRGPQPRQEEARS